jgi:hypothetical protein
MSFKSSKQNSKLMLPEPETTLFDRIALSFLGGLGGAAWGAFISTIIFAVTNHFSPSIIGWSAAAFAIFGFFSGNLLARRSCPYFTIFGDFSLSLEDGYPKRMQTMNTCAPFSGLAL